MNNQLTKSENKVLMALGLVGSAGRLVEDDSDITTLRHVRHSSARVAVKARVRAESVERRQAMDDADWGRYDAMFANVRAGLLAGSFVRSRYGRGHAGGLSVSEGQCFSASGHLCIVNAIFNHKRRDGKTEVRCHVVYDNQTFSYMLLQSFKASLREPVFQGFGRFPRPVNAMRILPVKEAS